MGGGRVPAPGELKEIPVTYQDLQDYFVASQGSVDLFALREETMRRVEATTGRPLLCYVMRTQAPVTGSPAYIEDADLTGIADLCRTVKGTAADVLLVSNGGVAEAAERIVRLLRQRFAYLRWVIPGNAFSAATLLCLSGDEIVMGATGSLGPIDPQVNGVPARAILRGFEEVRRLLEKKGPAALTAYVPLLAKYDVHTLEICKSAEELAKELATEWLSRYMLKCQREDDRVTRIVDFLSDYDLHKSHGRSIDLTKARELGLIATDLESFGQRFADLVRSLFNQYLLFFDKTGFFKLFENCHGVHWGRQATSLTLQIPMPPGAPPSSQPGSPHPPSGDRGGEEADENGRGGA